MRRLYSELSGSWRGERGRDVDCGEERGGMVRGSGCLGFFPRMEVGCGFGWERGWEGLRIGRGGTGLRSENTIQMY